MLGCTHVGGIERLGRVDRRRRTRYGFEVPSGREGSLLAPLPGENTAPSSRPPTKRHLGSTDIAPTLAGRGRGGGTEYSVLGIQPTQGGQGRGNCLRSALGAGERGDGMGAPTNLQSGREIGGHYFPEREGGCNRLNEEQAVEHRCYGMMLEPS